MRPAVLTTLTLAVIAACAPLALAQAAARSPGAAAPEPDVAQAIATVEAQLDSALAARDRAALERLVAPSFTWVHAADGRVEARDGWLAEAARGMALSRQRAARSVFEPTLAVHGGHAAVRTARIRLRDTDGARETWMRQTLVFVREGAGPWLLASGQGTRMYEGPVLDKALYERYAGTYVIAPGRALTLAWDGDALLGTLPNGSQGQIFLRSPTEEAVLSPNLARLRFILGPDGRPLTAALVRGEEELWRATRAGAP